MTLLPPKVYGFMLHLRQKLKVKKLMSIFRMEIHLVTNERHRRSRIPRFAIAPNADLPSTATEYNPENQKTRKPENQQPYSDRYAC